MKSNLITVSVLLWSIGCAQLAAGESREQAETHETAPLALTPAEYNNTIADLLGFPRDGEQWPERPPMADRLSPRRAFGPRFGLTREVKNPRDDDTKWPALMGPIRHSMKLETELFVEEAIFDGEGTFTALMTGNHGYVSDATAPIYGASATRSEGRPSVTRQIEYVSASVGRKESLTLYPVEFDSDRRAGLLTLPSVLAIGAYAVQPGPIPRGVRILERVACMELGEPTQGAETALPPDTLSAESTNRERTAAATRPPTCNTCHRRINPAGFAFEHYDAMGAWRAEDNGQPVDASGSLRLPGAEVLNFSDGVDFAHQLAASRRVRECYALHWTRYALGNHLARTTPGLEPIQQRFREDDSIEELLVSIAASDLFRARFTESGSGVHGP